MIERIELAGRHYEIDDDVRKYVHKKIGKLDRYMQAHARKSAHAEVILIRSKAKDKNQYTAEVILHIPKGSITAKDSTMNIYAAIDIVEAKLSSQLKKAKQKAVEHTERRPRIMRRLMKLAQVRSRG